MKGARRSGRPRPARPLLDLVADCFEAYAERLKGLGRHALAFVEQTEQDVLSPDEVVVEQARFFLGQHQHATGAVGKALKQP